MGGRIALLIGTGSFRDASLTELDTPASDVRELAALLRDPYIAGFDPVIELIDASTQQVGREIAHTLERRHKDDIVLLYYSGRILLDDEGQLHLAMVDTELDLLSPTSISAAFVAAEMDRSRSRRQLLIIDGRAGTGFAHGAKAGMNDITAPVPKLTLPTATDLAHAFLGDGYGRVVITACESGGLPRSPWPPRTSRSEPHPGNCPNSWFTHGLLEGLRGAADSDRDGRISVDELYAYARANFVRHVPASPPARLGELPGDLLIGYAPTRPSSVPKPSASTRAPKPGSLVSDRYRILAPLDEGNNSMFGGVDERSGRKVSIKYLRPPQSIDANALERFLREAQMAGTLDHPNVVAIRDVGFEGSSAFIVMEPLEGETLGALLRREQRLPVAGALEILVPALGAVEAAHAHGVVHRALHPENVFINRNADGSLAGIKVLGFGVSTALAGAKGGGALIGSPHYMAPEQALDNTALDVRTDVYAFGVLLYETLTGRRPFEADNHGAVLWKLGNGTLESPRALCPELPASLEAVVLRAMARERDARYAGLAELRLELEAAARDHGFALPIEALPLAAADPDGHADSLPPNDPKIETPAVFLRRAEQRPAGSRNWAYALSLAVVLAGAAGWLLSDGELAGETPPVVVPIPQPSAAAQLLPHNPSPSPTDGNGDRSSPAQSEPSAAPAPATAIAVPDPIGTPPPGMLGQPQSAPDAGWLDPVPRSAARAARLSRAEARAAKRRERELLKEQRAPDAGATLTIKRLPEPGDPAALPAVDPTQ